MRARVAITLAAAAVLAAPPVGAAVGPHAAAPDDEVAVYVQFAAFGPAQIDVLPGTNVVWQNVSERVHTVDADDGTFASEDLAGGSRYALRFDAVGPHGYHCAIHAGMTGEIDVRRVTLGPLPVAAVPAGDRVAFAGRTADPGMPVRIERTDGAAVQTIATAAPAADGTWSVSAPATRTGDYRAASDAGASQSRRLLVSDRRVLVRATRRGVAVRVTPALPYARVVLQQERRERFGWWPERTTTLDYVSEAAFRVARPARVRVVLVDRDGWTALATSPVLRLGRVRPLPAMPMPSGAHHGRGA